MAVETMTSLAEPIVIKKAKRESQAGLMWRRFKRHRLALVSLWIVALFYLVALLAEFLAPTDPSAYSARYTYAPPQGLQFFSTNADGSWAFGPYVNGYASEIDPKAMRRTFVLDPDVKIPVQFFAPSKPYLLAGFIPMSIKFMGVSDPRAPFYVLGADRLGRDLLSRLIHGTRISLSIGLAGVTLSLFFGIIIGGFAGYYGGWFDGAVMRVIEFIRSMPTIPLWLGLAAAMPKDWSALQTYFAITIILSLIGWTELARVVRGRFLSLRTEDFVTAAQLDGASDWRIITRHMVPSFMSHIIAAATLAIPGMILAETALSFLGLGLQAPIVSWGTLLQDAQNIRTLATAPWLLTPGICVVIIILSMNFLETASVMPLIPMADKPILTIKDMSIVFSSPDEADIEAVRQVDLTLTPGKTLALVGESGCGKSVTARAVLRLLDKNAKIQRGEILFEPKGEPATDIVRLKQDSLPLRKIRGNQISMIFQEPMSSLSPVHTIGDQIDEMMIIHEGLKPKQARDRTVALLDQVGIPGARERADAYPFQLSGGLRQRAMIAMALACTPQLLIADEPTTALDVTTQAQILDLLRQLQSDFGMAMLFITHDLGVVAEIADEVAVMYLGDVVEQGSVYDVFAAPQHPYTKALMSSIPKMARKAERVRLSPIKGTVPAPKDRPVGCAFTSRCPYAFEPCAHLRPERTDMGDGHHARCHLLSQKVVEAVA